MELPRCGKFNKAKQGAAGGRMKATLRERHGIICAWIVGFKRIVGPEKISVTVAMLPQRRERWLLLHQRAKRARGVAWAHSYAAKHL